MNSPWARTDPDRKCHCEALPFFLFTAPSCPSSTDSTCGIMQTRRCELGAGSAADSLSSKYPRRTSCRRLLQSDSPPRNTLLIPLCHLIFKFLCFQISGLCCTVVWDGQSGTATRGDRGETQENKVYYTHRFLETDDTLSGSHGKTPGWSGGRRQGQGRV